MVGIDFLWIFGGGLVAGLVGALLGLGGGLVAVPFLNLVMGVPIHQAAAAGLVSTLSVSCGAAGRYLRQGELVQVPVGLEMELGAALGGLTGGYLVGWLSGPIVQIIFALVMAASGLQIVRSLLKQASQDDRLGAVGLGRRFLALGLCFAAGVVSGLLGIGGGMVVVPILHLVLRMSFKQAAATSNFMMGLTALPALCGFIVRGDFQLRLAAPLALGVLLGASFGARIMPRIKTRLLKVFFVGILAYAAVEMVRKAVMTW